MKEFINKNEEFVEVNIVRLLEIVLGKIWLVSLASIIFAAITFAYTYFFVAPEYEASAMFYVNNNNLSVGDVSVSITSSDLTSSRKLVDSYIVILRTRESLEAVADYADIEHSYKEINDMLTVEPVNETEIFEVVVTSTDPEESEKIANAISYILPKRISNIIEGTSAKVVDSAVIPSSYSSPSYTNNTVIGFLLGLVLSVGIIVMREIFDISIRTDEDIYQSCNYPILASVPDMLSQGKDGYGYSYDTTKKTLPGKNKSQRQTLVGPGMSFAASEAYKLLRTKLQFSFADDFDCHVIGLSSALSGEGKSLTAINVAYSLSQLNKRVILIDCDMRRPTVAEKLEIRKKPGISSFLTGQNEIDEIIQYCGIEKDELAFSVITAGQNPPNPVELLSSEKMTWVVENLRENYDYVILDLPPVGEVSDAMAAAKIIDGLLLVVRQNYCNRVALGEAVRQFESIDLKVLGIIINCSNELGHGYYGKRYYKKYNNKYYNKYSKNTSSPENEI